jgi:hypothetical protein
MAISYKQPKVCSKSKLKAPKQFIVPEYLGLCPNKGWPKTDLLPTKSVPLHLQVRKAYVVYCPHLLITADDQPHPAMPKQIEVYLTQH